MPNRPYSVACVVGTRPEAIKMAPLMLALKEDVRFAPLLLATGQHEQMLIQALEPFGLVPDINLGIMKHNQTLDYVTCSVLQGVGEVLDSRTFDMILVHGDTTTTMAASMAAFYRHVPVGHVEAGLRSGTLERPFPEEMNRIVTDVVSSLWFAPTSGARDNLLRGGVDEARIFVTGNTVIDALKWISESVVRPVAPNLSRIGPDEEFILVTAHRRESWGEALVRISRAVVRILEERPKLRALVPMHKNPAVREVLCRHLGHMEQAVLCDPLDYPDFVWAMNRCRIILSDSGGVQEEASAIPKPVLILRDVTERPEALSAGSGVLVGTQEDKIIEHAAPLLDSDVSYREFCGRTSSPFGDGRACVRICDAMGRYLDAQKRA